jgi:hypothetical protein
VDASGDPNEHAYSMREMRNLIFPDRGHFNVAFGCFYLAILLEAVAASTIHSNNVMPRGIYCLMPALFVG